MGIHTMTIFTVICSHTCTQDDQSQKLKHILSSDQ